MSRVEHLDEDPYTRMPTRESMSAALRETIPDLNEEELGYIDRFFQAVGGRELSGSGLVLGWIVVGEENVELYNSQFRAHMDTLIKPVINAITPDEVVRNYAYNFIQQLMDEVQKEQ